MPISCKGCPAFYFLYYSISFGMVTPMLILWKGKGKAPVTRNWHDFPSPSVLTLQKLWLVILSFMNLFYKIKVSQKLFCLSHFSHIRAIWRLFLICFTFILSSQHIILVFSLNFMETIGLMRKANAKNFKPFIFYILPVSSIDQS